MWTTLAIVTAIFLVAMRVFLTAHHQTEVVSAGLIAAACLMIALGVSPLVLKLTLLSTVFSFEWWLLHRPPASEN